ncbi:response regulator [Bacillus sp. ISL-40]|uniref:response regulator transcription factor n=1 Tax=unclassified Bacillus (in: firmicutes) TaxID=185979 RepID=UPI001BED0DDE|nr:MULTISPECIES: helix-turn-helix domain-containing protein [unclassified Bacillus (in: firmicutes)]MBT2700948.1 response regulator [Bacillus sp. ISL-40]MBT2742954.1 response regulator [Bacillus sp. ISL-77]
MNQFQVLIVDDEIHSIRGVQAGVNWEKHDISSVFTANNLRQAQEVFLNNKVDLLLCDIEMPRGSGIDLLKWVREHFPMTEAIFLTCHSDFSYAKQALQLKSFNYLLKPVDYQELEDVIHSALGKIKKDQETRMVEESYLQLKKSHHSVMQERFWLDLINQVIPTTKDQIEKQMKNYHLSYSELTTFLPILFHVQHWKEELSVHEEKVSEYALQKALGEVIEKNSMDGYVLNVEIGYVLVIIALVEPINLKEFNENCNHFISQFAQFFSCELCGYIGNQVPIEELVGMVHTLQEFDRNNVTVSNQTIKCNNKKKCLCTSPLLPSAEWTSQMKNGPKDKFLDAVNQYFTDWKKSDGNITAQSLHLFYQDFLQLIFYVLQVKGIQANQVYSQNLLTEKPKRVLKSLNSLQEWVIYIADVAMNQLHQPQEKGSVVDIVKNYINHHLGEQRLTRDEIANYVYLNPDYLTRLFKKQTGLSISDYLQQKRIEYAKKLLIETNLPVSEVALSAGYSNFSYFSTIFKKSTQLNPMEYRKKSFFSEKSE